VPSAKPGVRNGHKPRTVERLSKELKDMLREAQFAAKPPKGMTKCPRCGVALVPTRTGVLRVHDDPLTGSRCPASKSKPPVTATKAKR